MSTKRKQPAKGNKDNGQAQAAPLRQSKFVEQLEKLGDKAVPWDLLTAAESARFDAKQASVKLERIELLLDQARGKQRRIWGAATLAAAQAILDENPAGEKPVQRGMPSPAKKQPSAGSAKKKPAGKKAAAKPKPTAKAKSRQTWGQFAATLRGLTNHGIDLDGNLDNLGRDGLTGREKFFLDKWKSAITPSTARDAWKKENPAAKAKDQPAAAIENGDEEYDLPPFDWVLRMGHCKTADEARNLFVEHEQAIHDLQVKIGEKPTVGDVEPLLCVGFSVINPKQWVQAIAAARKKNGRLGDALAVLVDQGREIHGKAWTRLFDEESRPKGKNPAAAPVVEKKANGRQTWLQWLSCIRKIKGLKIRSGIDMMPAEERTVPEAFFLSHWENGRAPGEARKDWLGGHSAAALKTAVDHDDDFEEDPDPRDRPEHACRVCGCTQDECEECTVRTGGPCEWFEPDLCSACAPPLVPAEVGNYIREMDSVKERYERQFALDAWYWHFVSGGAAHADVEKPSDRSHGLVLKKSQEVILIDLTEIAIGLGLPIVNQTGLTDSTRKGGKKVGAA